MLKWQHHISGFGKCLNVWFLSGFAGQVGRAAGGEDEISETQDQDFHPHPSPCRPPQHRHNTQNPRKKKKLENIPVSLKWGKEIWHVNDGGCIENGTFHPSSFMTSDISIEMLQYNLCLKFQLWKGPGSISLTRRFGTKTVLKASISTFREVSICTHRLSAVSRLRVNNFQL